MGSLAKEIQEPRVQPHEMQQKMEAVQAQQSQQQQLMTKHGGPSRSRRYRTPRTSQVRPLLSVVADGDFHCGERESGGLDVG